MSFFLIGVGFIINFVCGIWIVVQAFRTSVGWGLAVLFLPFASLVFIIKFWKDTKQPFFGSLASVVLIIMGLVIAPTPEPDVDAAEMRRPSRSTPASNDGSGNASAVNYASAAAPATSYQPPRTAYQPATTYTPAYNPPPAPVAPAVTDTQAIEDEWSRKPVYEQVHVDRATNQFYADKCKQRPENTYRIPKSVALMQGITEAKCR